MRQLMPFTGADQPDADPPSSPTPPTQRKLIPLDASLLDDLTPGKQLNHSPATASADVADVVYRRRIVPSPEDLAMAEDEEPPLLLATAGESHDRQWQKLKENKESLNKNRQSQCASLTSASTSPEATSANDIDCCVVDAPRPEQQPAPTYSNKSTFGKWKRRKATAPLPPIAASSASILVQSMGNGGAGGVQMLPLTDIRYELEVIEVQQQGLEKQGIQLEKMIRDRCEGANAPAPATTEQQQIIEEVAMHSAPNTKEVEDLILQLFEIVNEKNELFRRQAELMYL